jgi:hypothetical protein
MEIQTINNFLLDLWNFHLVLIGVSLSIFTLLYSFILNKRYELKSISEQIKSGDNSPVLVQKERFAIKYILHLKKINANCICIFIISTLLCSGSWLTLRVVYNFSIKQLSIIIIGILTIFLCIYVVFQFCKIYKHYSSEIKI